MFAVFVTTFQEGTSPETDFIYFLDYNFSPLQGVLTSIIKTKCEFKRSNNK